MLQAVASPSKSIWFQSKVGKRFRQLPKNTCKDIGNESKLESNYSIF